MRFHDEPQQDTVLNLDILDIICGCLSDARDILTFSLVSSALRQRAIQHSLSVGPVVLRNERSIRAFHCFLFADEESRAPWIRGIVIDVWQRQRSADAETEVGRCLVDILVSANRLQTLSISLHDDLSRYLNDPCLITAMSNVATLEEFSIDAVTTFGTTLVAGTKSPLRALCIRQYSEHSWDPESIDDTMSHLVSSLQSLEVEEILLDIDDVRERRQYRNLHSFTALWVPGIPRLDVLLHLFPNLNRTLKLHWSVEEAGDAELEWIRGENQRAQARHFWRSIDVLECEPPLLYVLGLRCPIQRLEVRVDLQKDRHLQYTVGALQDNMPQHLVLSLMMDQDLGMINRLFTQGGDSSLTKLVLFLEYSNLRVEEEEASDLELHDWDHLVVSTPYCCVDFDTIHLVIGKPDLCRRIVSTESSADLLLLQCRSQ